MIEQLIEEISKADIKTREKLAKKIIEILNEVSNSTGKSELVI